DTGNHGPVRGAQPPRRGRRLLPAAPAVALAPAARTGATSVRAAGRFLLPSVGARSGAAAGAGRRLACADPPLPQSAQVRRAASGAAAQARLGQDGPRLLRG